MTAAHAHPMVSKSDVARINAAHYPIVMLKERYTGTDVGRNPWTTMVRDESTGAVLYRCEGWNSAARGQALNVMLGARS